ncbi:MAG TPA: DNA-binding domain-containing protein [Stellaceae bacterium]
MPALRELQAAFRRALLDGDDGGLAAFVSEDGMAAAERLAVYRNNVQWSLADMLRDTFPAVCRLVDERFFAFAAHEFIRMHPPERACLAEYGARFADFLAAFPPCRELAYLPDVARLEWLTHAAAYAADGEPLAPAALAGVAARDTPRLVLGLHASFGFLASPWPIDRIWRLNRPGADSDETVALASGGVHLEVSRRGPDVVFRALDAAVFAFRHALAAGASLETATEAALTVDAAFDLGGAIADLFGDAAVIAFTLAPETAP